MKKHILFPVLFLLTILLSPGCKKKNTVTPAPPSSGSSGTNEVLMQNSAFSPASFTVTVNTTVQWTNKDGVAHNVTSTTGEFGSGTIASRGTYTHQFTTTGTFPYRCTIHSGMNGTIVVQ